MRFRNDGITDTRFIPLLSYPDLFQPILLSRLYLVSLTQSLPSSPHFESTQGLAGALSMVLQVLLLLPLRTLMNYQYRHGTSISTAYSTLRSQGRARFYAGLLPALIQGPVARFGDTASNVGVLALLEGNEWARKLPTAIKTALGSLLGALFRMVLMPVDTLKVSLHSSLVLLSL